MLLITRNMIKIAIISPSVRKGRNSHRVALYIRNFMEERNIATPVLVDLAAYNFPLFDERLKNQETPSEGMLDFAEKIESSGGVIIITPEYNGGYPASLKNAVDLLYGQWQRKPVAFISVSDGNFGGTQAITALQFVFWKIGALSVPVSFRIPYVQNAFDESGTPADKDAMDKRTSAFIKELLKLAEMK
ncbi:MAG: NAD(P)H-dependent oxidoreductase [Bacteroidales bacterium]|nr:NAD(P)H-dependent oxidoreductase [Bacteroidales bacterium]